MTRRLDGLPAAYTQAQLQAFGSGARPNDISGQMRNIAPNMTPGETVAAAAFCAQITKR
jgi:cytochrome c553